MHSVHSAHFRSVLTRFFFPESPNWPSLCAQAARPCFPAGRAPRARAPSREPRAPLLSHVVPRPAPLRLLRACAARQRLLQRAPRRACPRAPCTPACALRARPSACRACLRAQRPLRAPAAPSLSYQRAVSQYSPCLRPLLSQYNFFFCIVIQFSCSPLAIQFCNTTPPSLQYKLVYCNTKFSSPVFSIAIQCNPCNTIFP